MDIKHCLIVRLDRIYQIRVAADKTLTQRLFNMSVARLPPVRTSERTTAQKYEKRMNWRIFVKFYWAIGIGDKNNCVLQRSNHRKMRHTTKHISFPLTKSLGYRDLENCT